MTPEEARAFLVTNHRAVLATVRGDGRPQLSPVLATVDGDGRVLVSTRSGSAKARNLRRDPRIALCLLNDGFFGAWCHVEGQVEIVELPEAMDGLVDYFRRTSGEHPDWDDYRAAMQREGRVLLRFAIDRVAGMPFG
jgi:PPOX class probable F420-dependent enzyme